MLLSAVFFLFFFPLSSRKQKNPLFPLTPNSYLSLIITFFIIFQTVSFVQVFLSKIFTSLLSKIDCLLLFCPGRNKLGRAEPLRYAGDLSGRSRSGRRHTSRAALGDPPQRPCRGFQKGGNTIPPFCVLFASFLWRQRKDVPPRHEREIPVNQKAK